VLVDPPYEERRDYEQVVHSLKDCLSRFPGGTYLLWYPQLTRLEAHDLPPRLKRLPASRWLHVALRVRTPAADGFGMHGSGLFVVNPPWTLQATLQEVMPYLVEVLGLDAGAGFTLDSQEA
jgi:23S rRNA (adenine2030-N6)-methyltransferase